MSSAILDTNVLASGISGFALPTRAPARLLHAWLAGSFPLVLSEPLLAELATAMSKPYFQQRVSADQITRLVSLLHA